jgi:surface carbohydrate biosynthesis protein (TIGR04326 family)
MHLLEHAAEMLPKDTIFVIKPHPACPVNLEHYQRLGMRVSMEPLSTLLEKCDVAYASGVTSAAVDAYLSGVPIISVLDPKKLNLSPLRGCAGAIFIYTQAELANALTTDFTLPPQISQTTSFFCLDATIPRWRGLLIANDFNAMSVRYAVQESSLNSA